MKLDRMAFAKLVAFCAGNGLSVGEYEINELDRLTEIDVPIQTNHVPCDAVDDLLKQMLLGEKIPAIKAYRVLTGAGLKEAKDAVEKHWIDKRQETPTNAGGATLGDILGHATGSNKAGNDISGI